MVNTPTHFTNGSSSCIDLTFSSKKSYLTTGMEQSIYNNIPYGKLNFDILLPLPYYRKKWDFKHINEIL